MSWAVGRRPSERMTRLLVHVEGQTEETFVNDILAPHLYACGYSSVSARLLGNARQRDRRGGIRPWPAARRDIARHLKEDRGCIATTMVDYYGLPQSGEGAWPGRAEAAARPRPSRADAVERALADDIGRHLGADSVAGRFVPFVTMHEFEGLLFSDCAAFARGMGQPALQPQLEAVRAQFATPEEINDSPGTAPSKRVLGLFPTYQKVQTGALAAREVGLEPIRRECPHFRGWLERLERHPLVATP